MTWRSRIILLFDDVLTPTHDKLDKKIGNANLKMSMTSSLIDSFFSSSTDPSSPSKLIAFFVDSNGLDSSFDVSLSCSEERRFDDDMMPMEK